MWWWVGMGMAELDLIEWLVEEDGPVDVVGRSVERRRRRRRGGGHRMALRGGMSDTRSGPRMFQLGVVCLTWSETS